MTKFINKQECLLFLADNNFINFKFMCLITHIILTISITFFINLIFIYLNTSYSHFILNIVTLNIISICFFVIKFPKNQLNSLNELTECIIALRSKKTFFLTFFIPHYIYRVFFKKVASKHSKEICYTRNEISFELSSILSKNMPVKDLYSCIFSLKPATLDIYLLIY